MAVYYNENDTYCAQWLRNLIDAGHLPGGYVDERSIRDVRGEDLAGFSQCHFFAGIGVWPHALRAEGWPDALQVWTGSCPCQPFSNAGKRGGVHDDRHLWPDFFRLIKECAPGRIFIEQVSSADGLSWLDSVQNDLEASGYAFAAIDTCAAGIGAPHIRQRVYGMAVTDGAGRVTGESPATGMGYGNSAVSNGCVDVLGNAKRARLEGRGAVPAGGNKLPVRASGMADRLANPDGPSEGGRGIYRFGESDCAGARSALERFARFRASYGEPGIAGPANTFWQSADWIACRDGKWRPVRPGTQPLATGVAARVAKLRAIGNALCAPQARAFIAAAMECL
jgi:DNA (cytosine-5)-methyltransferase 1